MSRKLIILILLAVIAGLVARHYYNERKTHNPNEIILFGNVDVRQVNLSFRVSGLVKEIYFEEGDIVPAGSLVGILDRQPYTDQVSQEEANVMSIRASLNNADILLKRRTE